MRDVLPDLNVVLDVFLARDPWLPDSSLSAASLPTIFSVVRRNVDLQRAHRAVTECLASFDVVPVDRATRELAQTLQGSDFEDNLQIARAMLAGRDAIVTRDPEGDVGSPVRVLAPSDLSSLLPGSTP